MREEQLSKLVDSMNGKLAQAEKASGAEREALCGEIMAIHADATNAVDLYRMEFRSLTHQERGVYKEKLRAHRSALKTIQQEVKWIGGSDKKGELLAGATQARELDNPELETVDGMIAHGRNLQDDSIKSLQRTVGTVAATRELGAETAVKVHAQTEQMQSLYDDLYEIDDMLDRSVQIVKRMARRVASQRVLWILTFLIVCGIITIVVLRTQGKDGEDSGDRADNAAYHPDGGFVEPVSRYTRQAMSYYSRRRAEAFPNRAVAGTGDGAGTA